MLKRFTNLVRGFLNLLLGGMEKKHPEALLELERENLRKRLVQYNQGLVAHSAHCERLMAQVRKLQEEERNLRAKITACLGLGKRDEAAQLALRHEGVQREWDDHKLLLQQAEKTYEELRKARDQHFKEAQAKLETLRFHLDELKIKRATAELSEMASGLITQVGGSGDTLERLRTMVEEEQAKAAGRARVARDNLQEHGSQELREAEQKALADQALTRFLEDREATLQLPESAEEQPPTRS